ncbi:MAG: hypothetical protein KAV00_00945 [Phycisphaerae bacterium]|nr:hypothetical protein [Phycisphaerae bacterium]
MALLMLAIFSTLAVAFASTTDLNLQKSNNCRNSAGARLAAEGGLSYHIYTLAKIKPSAGMEGADLIADIAEKLATELNGTPNLNGACVSHDAESVTINIPAISLGDGCGSFSAMLWLDAADSEKVWLKVTGRDGTAERTAKMAFQLNNGQGCEFDYGVATKGSMIMSGSHAKVLGANDPGEANSLADAFGLTNKVELDGDIFCTGGTENIEVGEKVSVAGETNIDVDDSEHVHKNIGEVDFPEPDPSMFEELVELTLMADHSPPKGTYTNIRIPANTNPTFASKTTLEGVIYVESPNDLHFAGQVTIRGVIVTKDARGSGDTNTIKFSGQVESYGVDTLPDTPEFEALKQIPGVFLMAPGFDLEFSGQFGTINGAVVGDSIKLSGQAGGTIKGPVIGYDGNFEMGGQGHLLIDRSGGNELSSCFSTLSELIPLPETYAED